MYFSFWNHKLFALLIVIASYVIGHTYHAPGVHQIVSIRLCTPFDSFLDHTWSWAVASVLFPGNKIFGEESVLVHLLDGVGYIVIGGFRNWSPYFPSLLSKFWISLFFFLKYAAISKTIVFWRLVLEKTCLQGPHIASVTLAAYECDSLKFPEPPYPDKFVHFSISFFSFMKKVGASWINYLVLYVFITTFRTLLQLKLHGRSSCQASIIVVFVSINYFVAQGWWQIFAAVLWLLKARNRAIFQNNLSGCSK